MRLVVDGVAVKSVTATADSNYILPAAVNAFVDVTKGKHSFSVSLQSLEKARSAVLSPIIKY